MKIPSFLCQVLHSIFAISNRCNYTKIRLKLLNDGETCTLGSDECYKLYELVGTQDRRERRELPLETPRRNIDETEFEDRSDRLEDIAPLTNLILHGVRNVLRDNAALS